MVDQHECQFVESRQPLPSRVTSDGASSWCLSWTNVGAAGGDDGWPLGQARPVLLAAVGRELPDQAAVRREGDDTAKSGGEDRVSAATKARLCFWNLFSQSEQS